MAEKTAEPKNEEPKRYPEEHSGVAKNWAGDDGLGFTILQTDLGHYCGYVRFPKRPLREPGYNGAATYVPVHGGLTFASEDKDGSMVYGFDCAHCDDDANAQTRDPEWLKAECERMAVGILSLVPHEAKYLTLPEEDSEGRAAVIDAYHDALKAQGIAFDASNNFGAMINLFCGKL